MTAHETLVSLHAQAMGMRCHTIVMGLSRDEAVPAWRALTHEQRAVWIARGEAMDRASRKDVAREILERMRMT